MNLKSDANIDASETDYLYIQESQLPNSGMGLFTVVKIYKGEIISKFTGEILANEQAKLRAQIEEDHYFINMLDGKILDSKNAQCFAKYANDTKGTINTNFKNNSKITLDDDQNICLVATQNIKANGEIFCGYGRRYWKKHI